VNRRPNDNSKIWPSSTEPKKHSKNTEKSASWTVFQEPQKRKQVSCSAKEGLLAIASFWSGSGASRSPERYAHMPNRETEKTQLIRHTLRYITLCFRLSDDQKVRFSMPIDGYLFLFHFFGQRRIIMGTNFERPLGFFRCEMREKIKKVDCNVVLNF